ncbi:MAG TPA: DUF748 domain-containing protein [Candidatus Binatia bacterium]|nr:DUF748 domain-containing protein [Candidatus Binatia bacterium]
MKRWHIALLAVVILLSTSIVIGYQLGVRLLQDRIVAALGAGSSVAELKVNWFSLDVFGVTIAAPKDWPTGRTFRAARVRIIPSLRTLLTDQIHISSIVFEEPYVSVMRTSGKWVIFPGLTEAREGKKNAEASRANFSPRAVTISKIELQDGIVELFDATVSRPPLKTRLERVGAVIRNVTAPSLQTRTHIESAAIVKGIRRDGRARVSGWVGPNRGDSSSQVTLDAVDLVSLQPYLVKIGEGQVRKGTLDLRLNSDIRANRLDGKGKIIIRDLEFAQSRGYLETFMGIPRSALINFLKNNENAIDVDFVLTGDTSNPSFSINEAIATRVAMGMAAELGVSIRGLAEDFGTLGRRSVEGAAGVAEGVGSVVRRLFGGSRK